MQSLGSLSTESRNPQSEHIDELSTLEMLTVINQEDATVAAAVAFELPAIATAVDEIAARFAQGGRLFYIGAGTSGRLGVLDASECPPTFSVPPALVQGLIAGGDAALRNSSEHSEDSPEEGASDLVAAGFGIANATDPAAPTPDTLVGIAASGRTPTSWARCSTRASSTPSPSVWPASPTRPSPRSPTSPSRRSPAPR